MVELELPLVTGVSNISPGGQNRPGEDSNPTRRKTLENMKEGIHF